MEPKLSQVPWQEHLPHFESVQVIREWSQSNVLPSSLHWSPNESRPQPDLVQFGPWEHTLPHTANCTISQTHLKIYPHSNLNNQKDIVLVHHKGSQGRNQSCCWLFFFQLKIFKKKKTEFKNNRWVSPSFQILFSTFKSLCTIWMSTLSLANRGNSVFVFIFAFIWHSHTLYLKPLTEQWITDLGNGDASRQRTNATAGNTLGAN